MEELRLTGGPSRASRCGLLLRIDEVEEEVEEVGEVGAKLEGAKAERSCVGAGGGGKEV